MAFYDVLKKRGVSVTMRREFGGDIAGGVRSVEFAALR